MAMGLVLILLSLLLICVISIIAFLIVKKNKLNKNETITDLKLVLENRGFSSKVILYVNRFLSLTVNKFGNILYIIRNYNPDINSQIDVEEVLIQFIKNFEITNNTIILRYFKNGEEKTAAITPINSEVKKFIHKVFHNSCAKKITEKLPDSNFTLFSASDYQCSYFWGYSPSKALFCYLKLDDTLKKPINYNVKKINLLKENFTIDVKYNYFEAPIEGIAQQLSIFDNNFLADLYLCLLNTIKEKYALVCEDMIYYNNLQNIVYLTNAQNSLLSLKLDEIAEVKYSTNRISFIMKDSQRMVNYMASEDFINEFDDFVVGYNLRKIAHNFNYSTDKLINATPNTKFIVDFSRYRLIYCANINTFSRFSYIIFSFSEIINVKLEKISTNSFVRIFLKNGQIIDVTCAKYEVAEYIMALIRKILDES